MCVHKGALMCAWRPVSFRRCTQDQRVSQPLNVKRLCFCECVFESEEDVSVKLSGQQLINEVLEMFDCMNTHTHTHTYSVL